MLMLLQELDDAHTNNPKYFAQCFKCLRALSKERDIFPQCFSMSDGIIRDNGDPIDGGGAAVSDSSLRSTQTEH